MIKDQRNLAVEKVRAEIAEIERQAMPDLSNWPAYLAQCSDIGRDSAMSAALSKDAPMLKRWRAFRMALSELLYHGS
jgi:hypothetical protein